VHELSVTRSLLGLVLEKAQSRKTTAVNLLVGELSGMVDECLQLYFKLLSEGTVAQGAQLNIRRESPTCHCEDCQHQWPSAQVPVKCPSCGGNDLRMRGGIALLIESIEVEDEHTGCREHSQSQ
jgi:hydrogenase nickel incorporation protein HypA/HybF